MEQKSLFDTVTQITANSLSRSTATVLELRSGIFAPIDKISTRSIIYKDFITKDKEKNKPANVRRFNFGDGTIEIKNVILTQTHRALLDAILSTKRGVFHNDGEVEIVCTLKEVQENYSGQIRLQWFKEKLDEMKTSTIDIIANDMESLIESSNVSFSIISSYTYNARTKKFTISLNTKYSKLFEKTIAINYDKFVKEINSVRSPFVQAVIRFFITHEECKYTLDKVISVVGYGSTDRARRTAIEDLNRESKRLLSFNIVWDSKGKMFSYSRVNNIKVFHPSKDDIPTLIQEKIDKINQEPTTQHQKDIDLEQKLLYEVAISNNISEDKVTEQFEKFKQYNQNDESKITLKNWKLWCSQYNKFQTSKNSKKSTAKKNSEQKDYAWEYKKAKEISDRVKDYYYFEKGIDVLNDYYMKDIPFEGFEFKEATHPYLDKSEVFIIPINLESKNETINIDILEDKNK